MAIKLPWPKIVLPFKKKPPEAVVPPVLPTPETETLTNKTLAELIDDKLNQFNGKEMLVIKINKQGLLVFVGVLLFVLWLRPWVRLATEKIVRKEWSITSVQTLFRRTPSATPLPSSPPVVLSTIRVRMGSPATASAETVKALLTAAGFNQLEVTFDATIDQDHVLIAPHADTGSLSAQLTAVFESNYTMSSSAAALTDDSQVAATILVGSKALKKK